MTFWKVPQLMATSEVSPFVLSWQPERRDYTEAILARSRAASMPLRISVVLFEVLGALIALFGFAVRQPFLLAVGLGLIAMFVFRRPLVVWRLWRSSQLLRRPVQASVVPGDGVISSISGVTIHISWSIFDSFLETKRVFVIQIAGPKLPFVLLAKRGLTSESEVGGLRDILVQESRGASAK